MDGFGDKKNTFMHWVYAFTDGINKRFSSMRPSANGYSTKSPVWSVSIFESFVCLHVDREKASLESAPVRNKGEQDGAIDIRSDKAASLKIENSLKKFKWLKFMPIARQFHVLIMNFIRARTSRAKNFIKGL
jgi:hypothetical protein